MFQPILVIWLYFSSLEALKSLMNDLMKRHSIAKGNREIRKELINTATFIYTRGNYQFIINNVVVWTAWTK